MKCKLCRDNMTFKYNYKDGNTKVDVYVCSNCGWIHEEVFN